MLFTLLIISLEANSKLVSTTTCICDINYCLELLYKAGLSQSQVTVLHSLSKYSSKELLNDKETYKAFVTRIE